MRKNSKGFAQIIVVVILLILVGGAAYYLGTQKNKVMPSPSASPTPTTLASNPPKATTDPTANWTMRAYNPIALKYPPNWQISGGGVNERLSIGPALEGTQIYDVRFDNSTQNPDYLSSKEYVDKFLADANKGDGPGFHYESKEDITIGGKPAVILHGVFAFDQSLEEIFIADGNIMFTINYPVKFDNPNLLDPVKNYDIVQQILSTIKFTN